LCSATAKPDQDSHPSPHAFDVTIIRRAKLAAHPGFLEGEMNPIGGSEDRDGCDQHWLGTGPYCNA
jgi:hypothetical protein